MKFQAIIKRAVIISLGFSLSYCTSKKEGQQEGQALIKNEKSEVEKGPSKAMTPEKVTQIKTTETPILEVTFDHFYAQILDQGWVCLCDQKAASALYPEASLILKKGAGQIMDSPHLVVSFFPTETNIQSLFDSLFVPLPDGEKPFIQDTKIAHADFQTLSKFAVWPQKKNISSVIIKGPLAIVKFDLFTLKKEPTVNDMTFLGKTMGSLALRKK
jgi:hypothetical protein